MSPQNIILICDDDPSVHSSIKMLLKGQYLIRSAYHGDEALHVLKQTSVNLVILDIQMRTENEGLQLIPKLKGLYPEVEIIINSGKTEFETVKEALKLGASDYIHKDFEHFELVHVINLALEKQTLKKRANQQAFEVCSQQKSTHLLIGQSGWMQKTLQKIEKIKNSDVHVLILGETGTGKEVIARQLRRELPDGGFEPFVAVDSATIQSSMAESILFGHEKGAFTGAERVNKGIFEQAHGGIIYFDEIGNMPLDIQSKLLRVLQEKEIMRVGGQKVIPLNFRVVCATNKNLEQMVRAGSFKEDLLQRINVIPIHTIPLHQRVDDIPPLIQFFLSRLPAPKNQLQFTEAAIKALQLYPWPGNVRELSNVIAYVSTLTESPTIDIADLPPQIQDAIRNAPNNDHLFHQESADFSTQQRHATHSETSKSFYQRVAEFEATILKSEYLKYEGNVSKLALTLRMDRSHLYSKLKEYGIHTPRISAKN